MSRILVVLLALVALPVVARAQEAPTDIPEGGAPAAVPADAAAGAAEAPPASPEAAAANEAFQGLVDKWNGLIAQLRELQKQRDAAQGEARAGLETQMAEVRKQTGALVDEIAKAGLAVFKLDQTSFPVIYKTVLDIIQFHVIGDANGDGGDQYEKALPLVKELIDAGGGPKWPALYLLGGAAAYNTGDLDLAEQYFKQAEAAGQFANVPEPTGHEPPSVKLRIDAQMNYRNLATHRKNWEAEQAIRAAEAQADDLPRVKFTTSKGDIVIELFENEAPQSVANFITLVKKGYYDGVTFHRVLPLFMAQGGDPDGTGGGGPGYNIPDEQRAPKARHHFRGSLSMANTGQPNSGGSQFFLTFVPTSYLDGRHAVFGRVIEGMDVAASLKRRDPSSPGPKPAPDKILKAEVLRDRGHEYKFDQLPE